MPGPFRRFVPALAVTTLLISLLGARPAAAFRPPDGGGGACNYVHAGWIGAGGPGGKFGTTGAEWDGSLQWELCVIRTSVGMVKAKTQLSSEVDMNRYDRFTGLVIVRLQICNQVGGFTTIDGPDEYAYDSFYDHPATTTSQHYYFDVWKTDGTSPRGNPYRIWVRTWNGVIIPNAVIAPNLYLGQTGATGSADFYSNCMTA